jgi:hypothetical protein
MRDAIREGQNIRQKETVTFVVDIFKTFSLANVKRAHRQDAKKSINNQNFKAFGWKHGMNGERLIFGE